MQRIVDGIAFEGKVVPGAYQVRTWVANGVLERSVAPVIGWEEVGPVRELVDALGFPLEPKPLTEEEIAERHENALRKAAQRAKTMCRRIIIAEGFDELLTITYRENQQDRDLCKRHFKEWVRRMKRAFGGEFRYCASFERQQRGAMHVHVACHKLPVHVEHRNVKVRGRDIGTRIWRSIVGADNGLVFVGGKSRFGAPRAKPLSLAAMAGYVSKYIMKDYAESPAGANRYSRSNGAPLPEVERMVLANTTLFDAMCVTFECGEGDVVVSHRLSRWGERVWLCTEKKKSRDGADWVRALLAHKR